jgi:hypothetical protein
MGPAMARNILIFSDGTGQVGGRDFDEVRTNVYKLFRATRVSPDSSNDPAEQAAFYDPGLGSRGEGGFLVGRIAQWFYKTVSQATGLGLTQNIIDCYAAIIRLGKPDDRIFVFGFSRGAYTARCVAAVVTFCGIPTRNLNGGKLPLDEAGSKKLATYAVKHVYQFTPSRKEHDRDRAPEIPSANPRAPCYPLPHGLRLLRSATSYSSQQLPIFRGRIRYRGRPRQPLSVRRICCNLRRPRRPHIVAPLVFAGRSANRGVS